MRRFPRLLNLALTASLVIFAYSALIERAAAQDDGTPQMQRLPEDQARLDDLFDRLQHPELANWQSIEEQIWIIWSRSGSATADFLLMRGRAAMEAGDTALAIATLTALIDHAPQFAEGWNARATAYYMADLYGPSIADIQQTLMLEPRHFGALSGLGQILRDLGEDQAALEAFQAAAEVHPHRTDLQAAIAALERRLEGTSL